MAVSFFYLAMEISMKKASVLVESSIHYYTGVVNENSPQCTKEPLLKICASSYSTISYPFPHIFSSFFFNSISVRN